MTGSEARPPEAELLVRLEGRLVTLSPRGYEHEDDLLYAGRDADVWGWLPGAAATSRESFRRWLDRWGTGANVDAKLLLLEHAFGRLGCRRVEFKTDDRNTRSRRALEAIPAQFEGVFRKHMLVRGGERRDSAYYSVIDDEWTAVRGNLERRLAATDPPPSEQR
ncbi:MAG: GNAT family N-acetyltransferase [Actinomycetota bacterium]|nr:GNAT family N-acetyltransferase [Actinomycetota bacterium]